MSGGSLEYLFSKVNGAVDELKKYYLCDNYDYFADIHSPPYIEKYTPKQQVKLKKFIKHLNLIADALHDIEWVIDCDKGQGDEMRAITKVLNHNKVNNDNK